MMASRRAFKNIQNMGHRYISVTEGRYRASITGKGYLMSFLFGVLANEHRTTHMIRHMLNSTQTGRGSKHWIDKCTLYVNSLCKYQLLTKAISNSHAVFSIVT